ncbi:MAG: 4a-hydroxytetrahydrobiopterin dehydratase [Fibrobacter sp.]|jgi:4a-hydroxytetrahydrobiopterin dehydratase|nr:4a-hydroxytetrahydrobiopterin dehydratase [Fibrobacter sp.]
MSLKEKHCTPLDKDTRALDQNQEEELLRELKGWEIDREKTHKLTKTIKTETFMDAVRLIRKIAEISESEQHHPDLHLYYNNLVVDLYSHKVGGLTMNDFIMAAKFDDL